MVRKVMDSRGWRWLGVLALVWLATQILPTTRLVFHPQAVAISDGVVTLQRDFPSDWLGLPRPRLSYVETVTPMTQYYHGGHPCTDSGGPFRYARAESLGRWDINDWAGPCLSDPLGYTWAASWTWHVGEMQMGPVTFSHRVLVP